MTNKMINMNLKKLNMGSWKHFFLLPLMGCLTYQSYGQEVVTPVVNPVPVVTVNVNPVVNPVVTSNVHPIVNPVVNTNVHPVVNPVVTPVVNVNPVVDPIVNPNVNVTEVWDDRT